MTSEEINDVSLYQGVFAPHLLVGALGRDVDRPVLCADGGAALSAKNVADLVSQYSQALSSLGILAASRVGILSGNKLEILHVTNASLLNEYVVVPLHPMGSLDDYLYVLEDAEVEVLIFDPGRFGSAAGQIQKRVGKPLRLLALGETTLGSDLCALSAGFKPKPLVAPVVRGDQLTRLSYSGGTTGKPKAIVGTHTYNLACLLIQLIEWEWPAQVRQLICAPLSHSGAAVFMPTLLKGGSVVVLPGFDPVAVMEAIERHRITCVLLVPTMIYALLDHPRFGHFDLSSLETIFYGASAISPVRLKEAIGKFGPIFFQFYGQAEAPMSVTVMRKSEHDINSLLRLASCGRPVPWVHVSLLDDAGLEVRDGVPGEICVRGPLVMAGYLNKPEQTKEVFAGDWLHTGDIAVRDVDGFLRIVDRKKDMIITGGFNVYPREVEDVLAAHPAVANCCVIGVADEHWGEAVKAVVVLRPGQTVGAEELIALVREHKGPVQAPKSIEFVDSIPVTGLGKPDKKGLRLRYARPAPSRGAGSGD